MEAIYLFAIVWILFNSYSVYKTILCQLSEDEKSDIYDEMVEMCRSISPTYVVRIMLLLYLSILVFDLLGFYFTYTYAYAAEGNFYTRILLYAAFIIVFIVDRIIQLRHTVKIAAAIKTPDIKPDVLKRFMRMTESGNAGDMMDTISTIARFTASLQLLLYTVIA